MRASRLTLGVGAVLGAAVLAVLHADRGRALWDFSEGVYALTSRLLIHGGDLYGHVVVAQPPGLFLFGGGALAVHDDIEWLRLCVGAWQLLAGVLCARIVWRLTGGSRVATALTAPAALLLPWNLHEHGALTPELIAPPLLLGAVLLASRPKASGDAGILSALAVAVKLPYALPAAVIVLLSANRRRAVLWAAVTLAVEAVAALAVFGDGLWRYIVVAQSHSGWQNAHDLLRVWAQEGWNLLGLVVAASAALWWRRRLADPALVRVSAGLALAMLLTLLTNLKHGTALNIVAPIELSLLPLAVAGVVAAKRAASSRRLVAIPAVALAFVAAQSISLLASPQPTAPPFLYPTSQPGTWQRGFSNAEIDTLERQARSCPPGEPYGGGLSYIAFLARRDMPDGQPDTYLTRDSPTLSTVAKAIDADKPTCP
jgi:hypothetical protein